MKLHVVFIDIFAHVILRGLLRGKTPTPTPSELALCKDHEESESVRARRR